MKQTSAIPFTKGHGTGNDFVVVPNADGDVTLSPAEVSRICDRRFGIGADGVLLATPVRFVEGESSGNAAKWFMDYRNADGSIAQMCGNGARVFARYLAEEGLETASEFEILTRGGPRQVTMESSGDVRINMGMATGGDGPDPVVDVLGVAKQADAWWVPNPHVVVFVDDIDVLARPLPEPKVTSSRFPDGQNVEYVQDVTGAEPNATLHARMRVHERGVGETSSCGTGACAVSLAIRRRHNHDHETTTIVDVPGGRLLVTHHGDGQLSLTGPAVLVATGHFEQTWWGEER